VSKINRYGFIHVSKEVRDKFDLPEDQDVAVDLEVNEEDRTLTYTVGSAIEPEPKKGDK
jgi:hypothetical protein